MVSAVWFAWSKCPPLHPCCHCGSQAGQNNPESNSPSIYFTILSACRPVAASSTALYLTGFFFCPCQVLSLGPDLSPGGRFSSLSWLSWISDPCLQRRTHTHTLTRTSCSCLFAPLPLFCASLYSSVSLYPPPLLRAPCLLMPLWYCRVV